MISLGPMRLLLLALCQELACESAASSLAVIASDPRAYASAYAFAQGKAIIQFSSPSLVSHPPFRNSSTGPQARGQVACLASGFRDGLFCCFVPPPIPTWEGAGLPSPSSKRTALQSQTFL